MSGLSGKRIAESTVAGVVAALIATVIAESLAHIAVTDNDIEVRLKAMEKIFKTAGRPRTRCLGPMASDFKSCHWS